MEREERNNLILTTLDAVNLVKDADIQKRIQHLAQNDQNLLIRSKALQILK